MYTLHITTSKTYRYMVTKNNTNLGLVCNDLTKVATDDLRTGVDPWKTWITHHGDVIKEYPLKNIEDISAMYPELYI